MRESVEIIRENIKRYKRLLTTETDETKRRTVERLLDEAKRELALIEKPRR